MNANRSSSVWWLAVVVAATVGAYAPALSAPFIWDDAEAIADNATIVRLWPPSVALQPPSNTPVGGRPVVNLSFAVNHAINSALGVDQRPDPNGPHKTVGYHVVNIVLHVACGLLLFGIIRRTLSSQRFDATWANRAVPIALVVTTLWLLHPVQSEAVNYLTQRTELLVSVCYLGTLYLSIRGWHAGTSRAARAWSIAAIVVCLIGMGSKEVMLTAPLVVVLYDRAFRFPSWKALASGGRTWFYLALAATSLVCLALIFAGARDETVGFALGVPWYRYLYSQGWAIPHYLGLVLWPRYLTLDYGIGVVHGARAIPGLIFLGAFALMTILAWRRPSRWGWFGFLGAWFFLTLAPSSSVVPIISEIAAERRMYLALAAVIMLAIAGLDGLRRLVLAKVPIREDARKRQSRAVGAAVGAWPWAVTAIAAMFVVTTAMRSRTYASAESIWRDAAARRPSNPRAHVNLGNALAHQDPARRQEAESLYRRAAALDSTYGPALYNLGEIALSEGRVAEALPLLERAARLSPNDAHVLDRYGRALMRSGDVERAIQHLERAANRAPSNAEILGDLGAAYSSAGRLEDAVRRLAVAVDLDPTQTATARALGAVLVDLERPREAVPILEQVVSREPDGRFGQALLSLAYAEAGRDEDAVAAAVRATDGSDDAYVLALAGQAMLRAHRASAAEEFLERAAKVTPNDPQVLTTLGAAEAALGKREKAARSFRRALSLAPNYLPAKQELERLMRQP
jgi:tetratricopeptide (TPR) repeat protein